MYSIYTFGTFEGTFESIEYCTFVPSYTSLLYKYNVSLYLRTSAPSFVHYDTFVRILLEVPPKLLRRHAYTTTHVCTEAVHIYGSTYIYICKTLRLIPSGGK
uniref:Uncharacterized protein n=1 Tax=Micromonas pusilla TaxID=38833 RepID=A0A7R9TKU8_MICPS